VPEPEHGGYFAARMYGYWKEAGIDVEILPGGPNADIEKRVAIDPNGLGIVRGDSVFLARERGLPIVSVMSYFQHDPQGIMVREDSPVRSFADLDGKTVSATVGATFTIYLQKKYHLNNLKLRPVTGSVANFIRDPDYIQQAFPTSEPFYALKEGVKSRVLQISDSGFDPYRCIAANEALVKNHPEWMRAFAIGAYRGWKEYCRNPLPVNEAIKAASPGMDIEGMKFSYREMRRLRFIEGQPEKGESMGQVSAARWDKLHADMMEYGLLTKPQDIKAAYSDAFTPEKVGEEATLPPVAQF
jgi:NitT/TauT family transport system substrate-binding protein